MFRFDQRDEVEQSRGEASCMNESEEQNEGRSKRTKKSRKPRDAKKRKRLFGRRGRRQCTTRTKIDGPTEMCVESKERAHG